MIITKKTLLAVWTVAIACALALVFAQAPSYADEPDDASVSSEVVEADGAQAESSSAPEADGSAPQEASSADASQDPAPEEPSSSDQSEDSQAAEDEQAQENASEEDEDASEEQRAASDEERQGKIDELQAVIDEKVSKAHDSIAQANDAASRLPAALGALSEAYLPLDEQRESYAGLLAQGTSINDQVAASQNRIARIEVGLQKTREQMSQDITIDLGDLLRGEVDLAAVESMPYLLNKLATAYEESLAEAKTAQAQVQAKRKELDPVIVQAQSQVSLAIHDGNVAAFEVESLCAEIRQHEKDAADTLEEAEKDLEKALEELEQEYEKEAKAAREAAASASSAEGDQESAEVPEPITADEIVGLVDAKQALEDARSWHNGERASAQEQAGAWYDSIDALSSTVVDTPSFGVGDDFALSEPVFVTKWGNAIDAFYANWSATVGQQSPMQGLGKVMARCAYEQRIDPRLCAAVSIVESSGGLHCIKPFNAWGWGAADSDPEGLAFGWSAWDEAIDAWHTGVATNQAGLANPICLSSFGDTYCSTPIWAKNVCGYMMQIDELAESSATATGAQGTQEASNVGSNAVNKSQLVNSL